MKHLTFAVTAIAASVALASPVFADDAHHPEKTAAAKPSAEQSSQTIKGMQDNVKKMRAQLDRAAKARTDSERQSAMAEHMRTMQDHMAMAHSMGGGMAMGCPMMGQGMGMMGMGRMGGSSASDVPSAATDDRLQRMERRMDMMEQMMKQQGGNPTPMPAQ